MIKAIDKETIKKELDELMGDLPRIELFAREVSLTPVFEESTFVQMLYFTLVAANSALNKNYVSLTDMVEEIYRITGERYVLTEADIYDRWKKGCTSFGVMLESVKPFSKERY